MRRSLFSFLAGFAILFLLYHAAEYMIVFRNSPIGFLGFQFLFFLAAWFVAKRQFGKGFSAWGLPLRKNALRHLIAGMIMGILMYGSSYIFCLLTGIEKLEKIPGTLSILSPLLLFVFGNFFSSFSEDILTRGYICKHFSDKFGSGQLVFISAAIYLLNHIYRLGDGLQTYIYLFMLGIIFALVFVLTKQLWFTGGMHWAGNSFFYLSHELFGTTTGDTTIAPNYILSVFIVIFIVLNYLLIRKTRLLTIPVAE